MRKAITLTAAGLMVAAVYAGAALAATHPFAASYSGRVTEKVVDDSVTGIVAGKNTAGLARSTLAGTVKGSQANACSPLTGPGTIKSGTSTIKLSIVTTKSRACAAGEDDRNHINVSGQVKVAGGTGKYAGASGLLTIKGTYNRSNGLFSVKFSGSLKY
jgi:hypothetical protein